MTTADALTILSTGLRFGDAEQIAAVDTLLADAYADEMAAAEWARQREYSVLEMYHREQAGQYVLRSGYAD